MAIIYTGGKYYSIIYQNSVHLIFWCARGQAFYF